MTSPKAKGGHARAAKLSAEERSEISRRAARARWDRPRRIVEPVEVPASGIPLLYLETAAAHFQKFARFVASLNRVVGFEFAIDEPVEKRAGYEYPGFIVAAFYTRAGLPRYVVEHATSRGMLHIFNGDQLRRRAK